MGMNHPYQTKYPPIPNTPFRISWFYWVALAIGYGMIKVILKIAHGKNSNL